MPEGLRAGLDKERTPATAEEPARVGGWLCSVFAVLALDVRFELLGLHHQNAGVAVLYYRIDSKNQGTRARRVRSSSARCSAVVLTMVYFFFFLLSSFLFSIVDALLLLLPPLLLLIITI